MYPIFSDQGSDLFSLKQVSMNFQQRNSVHSNMMNSLEVQYVNVRSKIHVKYHDDGGNLCKKEFKQYKCKVSFY